MPRTILANPEPPEPSPQDRYAGHRRWRLGRRAPAEPEQPDTRQVADLNPEEQAVLEFLAGEYAAVEPQHITPSYTPLDLHRFAVVAYDPASARAFRSVIGMFPDPESAGRYAREQGLQLYDVLPATQVIRRIARLS